MTVCRFCLGDLESPIDHRVRAVQCDRLVYGLEIGAAPDADRRTVVPRPVSSKGSSIVPDSDRLAPIRLTCPSTAKVSTSPDPARHGRCAEGSPEAIDRRRRCRGQRSRSREREVEAHNARPVASAGRSTNAVNRQFGTLNATIRIRIGIRRKNSAGGIPREDPNVNGPGKVQAT